MTEETAVAELTPNVELIVLAVQVARHPQLNLEQFQKIAIESDAAQAAGDYAAAVAGAQSLLVHLLSDIAHELRRPPSESVAAFRERKLPLGNAHKHCMFLQHMRFLNKQEVNDALQTLATTNAPAPDDGTSTEAWSRTTRQTVFATTEQLLTRYAAWRARCSCDGGPVEFIVFQPIDGSPTYERAICEQCRCPRGTAVMQTEEPKVEPTPTLPAELLSSPFQLLMTVLHQLHGQVWRNDGHDTQLPLPQEVADMVNEFRQFTWVELPVEVDTALREMDKRSLMMACVRSVELLHGFVGPKRANQRARLQRKRQRRTARRRAQRAYSDGRVGHSE